MWFSNYRQKLQLLLIAFFIFIAFGAANDAWMPWVRVSLSFSCPRSFVVSFYQRRARSCPPGGFLLPTARGLLTVASSVCECACICVLQATLVVFLSMILLTDLLFLDQSQFQYNPDYKVPFASPHARCYSWGCVCVLTM